MFLPIIFTSDVYLFVCRIASIIKIGQVTEIVLRSFINSVVSYGIYSMVYPFFMVAGS